MLVRNCFLRQRNLNFVFENGLSGLKHVFFGREIVFSCFILFVMVSNMVFLVEKYYPWFSVRVVFSNQKCASVSRNNLFEPFSLLAFFLFGIIKCSSGREIITLVSKIFFWCKYHMCGFK